MVRKASGSLGLPHSSYSATVRGRVASSMVFMMSTKGTWERTTRKRSGRMLVTAPMSRPPALPPSMATRAGCRSAAR